MIYYLAYPTPTTGGDFINIEHILALQSLGLRARMVHWGQEGSALLPPDTVPIETITFSREDYIVIPENEPRFYQIAHHLPCKFVIHNQNSYYFLAALARIENFDIQRFGEMICPSHSNAELARDAGYRGSIFVVPPGLPDTFAPSTKKVRIAFSPRKLPVEAAAVNQAFRSLHPQYANLQWTEISGLTRKQVGEILGESAIYAAFSDKEAISLSCLEAMRAGCLVVGDHGGSDDYATPENGLWCEAHDILSFAAHLANGVRMVQASSGLCDLAQRARQDAALYTMEKMRAALYLYWSRRS